MEKKSYLNTKIFSSLQENRIASELGWETVSGSGARPFAPGDIISENWLGECKTHMNDAKSIYFNHDVWLKIRSEATYQHRKPIVFTDDGSQSLSNTWCVCLSSSIEGNNLYIIPSTLYVKKNISFDHLKQMADFKGVKRCALDTFKHSIFVYSLTWIDDPVYLMPFDSFKQVIEEQGK